MHALLPTAKASDPAPPEPHPLAAPHWTEAWVDELLEYLEGGLRRGCDGSFRRTREYCALRALDRARTRAQIDYLAVDFACDCGILGAASRRCASRRKAQSPA